MAEKKAAEKKKAAAKRVPSPFVGLTNEQRKRMGLQAKAVAWLARQNGFERLTKIACDHPIYKCR